MSLESEAAANVARRAARKADPLYRAMYAEAVAKATAEHASLTALGIRADFGLILHHVRQEMK